MKQQKNSSDQFFKHASAAIFAAAGVLWLIFACSAEYFDLESSRELPCEVSSADDTESLPSAKYCSLRSSVKVPSFQSSRRQESAIPAPFVLSTVPVLTCGADITAHVTPVPQETADPSTYVRAGPGKVFSILS